MEWTPEQKDAIETDQPVLLISAAAGSGKTAVLVARVLRLLREGGDITRMLIVTFTRAAAAEMRQRITDALEKESADPHLYRQQQRMGRAHISTLHTFCQDVIRQHFELIGIDPQARVGEDSILERLLNKATEEAMEAAYAAPTVEQEYLFDTAAPDTIAAMAERLRRFLLAMPDPWEWAERVTAEVTGELGELPAFRALMSITVERLREAERTLGLCEEQLNDPLTPERFAKLLAADRALLDEYRQSAEKGQLRGGTVRFMTAPRGKKTDMDDEEAKQAYQALRERFKAQVKAAVDPLPTNDVQAMEDSSRANLLSRGLVQLTRDIQERFRQLKNERNVLDYNDLEHYCLTLLREPEVAREQARSFDALFIDEYQDISPIQEEIIQALHQENGLFLVGDVKQSIYRFRQADPGLFMDKYGRYSLTPGGRERKILLQQNFRSAKNVLTSVNQVFAHAMRADTLEIEYDDAAALKPGPAAPEGPETEVHLLVSANEETGEERRVTDSSAWEARFIVERIQSLMKERSPEQPTRGRYRYRDIVILLRSAAGRASVYATALQQAGIPVYADADAQYYDLREIQDVMNLLRIIDNPYQDLPLLGACRVPCFGFTERELATIRIRDTSPRTPYYRVFFAHAAEAGTELGKKAADMLRRVERWRFLCAHMPLEDFIRLLLDESGIYYLAGAAEDGLSRQANLRLLCEKAAESETLYDFLTRTDLRAKTDDSRTAKSLSDQEDVVRIMTMHKSKGLEFPVVFLAGLSRGFRSVTLDQPMMDQDLGIAMSMIDPEERIRRHTVAERAMEAVLDRKAKAEEARILYVAMTRAKERLLLYGAPAYFHTALDRWKSMRDPSAALEATCMLDWIMPALGLHDMEGDQSVAAPNGSRWRVTLEPIERLLEEEPEAARVSPVPETGYVSPELEELLSTVLPEPRPLKVSVSALSHRPVTEDDQEETPETKRNVSRETLERHPRFMQERMLTPAERGSAVHKALGLLPYPELRKAAPLDEQTVARLLDRMREREQLTAQEREAIRPGQLLRFFESSLGRRALRSPTVRREWPFALQARPDAYLQGVIDLCFMEDGAWVLVDYKTDAVKEASVLVDRYREQLGWYRKALASLTGVPVRETYLYSVALGEWAAIS